MGAFAAATSAEGKRPFMELDRARLEELADLAALAPENARLLERSREQVERLAAASARLREALEELERSRAELRAGEERLRLALEAGGMGTRDWDVQGSSVRWSESLERIHGREPGSFPGTFEALREEMHPDDRDRVLRAIEEAVATRSSDYAVEYRTVRLDGEVRWLAARGQVVTNDQGAPVCMLGVCWDVTERRKVETRVRFLAEVSPLLEGSLDPEAPLHTLADMAVPEIADCCVIYSMSDGTIRPVRVSHSDPEHRSALEEAVRKKPPALDAGLGTGAVIRTGEPLFLPEVTPEAVEQAVRDEEEQARGPPDRGVDGRARSDLGQLELDRAAVGLASLVEAARDAFRATGDVELDVQVSEGLSAHVDPHRIERVLGNLVSNAAEHSPPGGTVAVLARPHEEGVLFQVSDAGEGIPKDQQERVFDRYWQGGAARRGGMGLGLAIARDIVEAHGGRIWLESGVGKGTTFSFLIPSRRPENPDV